jgi:hypothetical protein
MDESLAFVPKRGLRMQPQAQHSGRQERQQRKSDFSMTLLHLADDPDRVLPEPKQHACDFHALPTTVRTGNSLGAIPVSYSRSEVRRLCSDDSYQGFSSVRTTRLGQTLRRRFRCTDIVDLFMTTILPMQTSQQGGLTSKCTCSHERVMGRSTDKFIAPSWAPEALCLCCRDQSTKTKQICIPGTPVCSTGRAISYYADTALTHAKGVRDASRSAYGVDTSHLAVMR